MKWWLVVVAVAGCGESGNAPVDAAVGDDVTCIATLAAVPGSASFGSVTVGATSAATTFSITNAGTCASSPVSASITGANAADFQITGTTCAGRALSPAESCSVTATFRPLSSGARSASVQIDGGAVPLLVALDGTGAGFDPLTISPGSLTFAATHVGATSVPMGFTVTNTGMQAGGIPNVTFTGDTGEFTITNDTCSGQALPASGTCVIELALHPTSQGTKSVTIEYFSVGLGTTGGFARGSTLVGLALAPATHDFGTQGLTTTSEPERFVLTNLTTVASSATLAASLTGADAGQFSITTDTCSAALLAGGSTCMVDVVFHPTTVGAKAAMLHVVDAKLGTLDVPLSGTGCTCGGSLVANPTVIDFGSLAAPGTRQMVTVSNPTGSARGPLTTALAGANPGSYRVVNDTCAGATLMPAIGSCTLEVETTCTAPGVEQQASLRIGSPVGLEVMVAVKGTVGGKACTSVLSVSPTAKDFGAWNVATISARQTFTFTNFGGQPSAALMAQLTGTDANQFMLANDTCTGVTLAPSSSCTVDASFAPTTSGTKTAVLRVDGTGSAALTGLAPAGGQIMMSPATVDLGFTASGMQTFTVQNNGAATTGVLSASLAGANPTSFEIRNDSCTGATLAASATCTFEVHTSCNGMVGPVSTMPTVSAVPGGLASASVMANIPSKACFAVTNANPTAIPFGDQVVSTTSAAQTVSITNIGGQPTQPLVPMLTGPDAGDFSITASTCTGVLAPGAGCMVSVAFAPQSAGTKHAVLQVGTPAQTSLLGTGVP